MKNFKFEIVGDSENWNKLFKKLELSQWSSIIVEILVFNTSILSSTTFTVFASWLFSASLLPHEIT
ncbi:hypothetical protein [Spiroplasma taiwanense]|uniref:hypothetical protein n=1 Tax=Spiroplasma taiwanense TaxID=2145 RepID=UPI0005A20A68|nr:hypothetical protein [Spiroplasma taiwanense]